jgi:hypothetical protein
VLRGTGPIGASTLSEILCEATVSAVVREHGVPVTATVADRYATGPMRRALWVRDRCCRFPGCGRTHDLIAHHLVGFDRDGPTRLDNLVLLCRAHHRLVHRLGWRAELDDDGRTVRVTRPDGRPVAAAHRPPDPPAAAEGPPSAGRRSEPAADPPATVRHRGTHDRLTEFGRDVILHNWLETEARAAADPAAVPSANP